MSFKFKQEKREEREDGTLLEIVTRLADRALRG